MIIAAIGIYIEFSNPGLILPGVFGGISFILFLMSTQILPISATGLLLLLVGLVLIILEFFISSGFLALGGSVAIILGGIFFIDPIEADLKISNVFLYPLSFLLIISVLLVSYLIYKTKKRRISSSLSSTMGVVIDNQDVEAYLFEFDKITKKGRVRINSEIWNFVSDENLEIGTKVIIKERKGLTLKGGKKDA
jgi:membrane-bound serine protease (ClpP class)